MKLNVFAPSGLVALLLAVVNLGPQVEEQRGADLAWVRHQLPEAEKGPASFDVAGADDFDTERNQLGAVLVSTGFVTEMLPEAVAGRSAAQARVTVQHGDTLMAMLQRQRIDRQEAHRAIQSLRGTFDPRRLRAGQELTVEFRDGPERRELVGLRLQPDVEHLVKVSRSGDGSFTAEQIERRLATRMAAADATITSSLFEAGASEGVPLGIMSELIRVFSWDVDFQRDIRRGDRFEVLYDTAIGESGEVVRHGVVHAARLSVDGNDFEVFRYVDRDGHVDYYDRSGNSIRKALLRTPIDGARMSSGYGMRRHPILGYSKMHKGVDFAAPRGTPIYAAGDGKIERIGRWSSYGNYIRIRHNGRISTAYAHLNGFAKGLGRGDTVSQGQLIGYVGSTGRSTGPHLHYEVLVEGKQVNPNSIDVPTGRRLAGADRTLFLRMIRENEETWAQLRAGATQLASAQDF